MRTPEEIRRAIFHMSGAKRGAENEGDKVKAAMISRIIDALQWTMGEPSEFAEWLRRWEEIDAIAAGKKRARSN